ncbi:MAG: hypothetical protein V7K39_16325 [Nostoc sp.]
MRKQLINSDRSGKPYCFKISSTLSIDSIHIANNSQLAEKIKTIKLGANALQPRT